MSSLGVITWNMRGGTIDGDGTKKPALLKEMVSYCCQEYHLDSPPVFMLQETGNLVWTLDDWWQAHYNIRFSKPIGAGNIRCTTGLLIPLDYPITVEYDVKSQSSGTRSYITAGIDINDKTILLGSIHAVASGSAAEDDRAYLATCSAYDHFVCGGDYNCDPASMEDWQQFTARQAEQGSYYNVETTNDTTHRTESTGEERILDYVCVKNLTTGGKERLFNSLDRGKPYSDHWPVFYEINID